MSRICLMNGSPAPPHISVYDTGFLRGHAAFEYLRTYESVPFHLDDHITRLEQSCERLGIACPTDLVRESVASGIELCGAKSIGIKIVVTAGESHDGFSYGGRPEVILLAEALTWKRSPDIALLTMPFERPLHECKTLFYAPAIVGMREAKRAGADDVLFVSREGMVLETGRANFFCVVGGRVVTPRNGVLGGVTRKIVSELLGAEERDVSVEEVMGCEGAFITSTTQEIVPVTHIDGVEMKASRDVALAIDLFDEYVKNFLKLRCTNFSDCTM